MAKQDFLVIKCGYDFSKWLLHHTGNFPKSYRFSVATKLENAILDFIELVTVANMRHDKLPLLKKADECLARLPRPQRGHILQPRVSVAQPWVNKPKPVPTPTGSHKGCTCAARCCTLSGCEVEVLSIPRVVQKAGQPWAVVCDAFSVGIVLCLGYR